MGPTSYWISFTYWRGALVAGLVYMIVQPRVYVQQLKKRLYTDPAPATVPLPLSPRPIRRAGGGG